MGRRLGGIAVAIAVSIAWMVPVSGAVAAPGAWKVVATDLGAHTVFHSVACADATTCFAVGTAGRYPSNNSVIARWDGKSWTRVEHPRIGRDELWGITCPSATQCVAVGDYASATVEATLIEAWDGTRWTLVPSPNPSQFGNTLRSVSCSAPYECAAIGYLGDMHGYTYPIAEHWNGFDWHDEAVPYNEPATIAEDSLTGVSCPTQTRCVAVGQTVRSFDLQRRVLVDQWNGRRWSIRPVVQTDSTDRALASVTCPTIARCVAVGFAGDGALVERRDSTGWSIEPSAAVGAAMAAFTSVACGSARRCVAVGSQGSDAKHQHPLIESARGSTWSLVSAPATGGSDDTLDGVACASDSVCFAVGTTNASGHPAPLILRGPS